MTATGGFLEFFILEASEYVERLDGLLLDAGADAPDADALQRVARALRGTATMAKLPAFADVAAAIERVGRALHDGSLAWDQSLRGALIAAIDDLKTLLHAARAWTSAEDERAHARAAELSRYAPPRQAQRATTPAGGTAAGYTFLATETGNIAAGLELLMTRPSDAETAGNLLRRVQALRGVAGVKEVPPLADVLEATEEAVAAVQPGTERIDAEVRPVLDTAAAYLRSITTSLRAGNADVAGPSPARDAYLAAQDSWSKRAGARDLVVPIEQLFYADGTPGLVEASANPPTSPSERFRLELVSLSEHLRQVVDAARHAKDEVSTLRARRDLQRALRALQGAAQSFGEHEVAEFIGGHADAAEHVDFLGLAALEDLSSVLARPGAEGEHLSARLREISGGRDLTSAIGAGFGNQEPTASKPAQPPVEPPVAEAPADQPPAAEQPVAEPPVLEPPALNSATPPRPVMPRRPTPVLIFEPVPEENVAEPTPLAAPAIAPMRTPDAAPPPAPAEQQHRPSAAEPPPTLSDSLDLASAALIDTSLAALDALATTPLAQPAVLPEDAVVPIESLLYRGRAALDRAVELRDEMKRRGPTPDPEALDELFDLLELARAE